MHAKGIWGNGGPSSCSAVTPHDVCVLPGPLHHDQAKLDHAVLGARATSFGINNRDAHVRERTLD